MTPPEVKPAVTQRGARRRAPAWLWYFALAYAFSWAWLLPFAFTGRIVTAGDGWPTHFPALLGPLLAAFVVTAATAGRAGVADLLRRMVRVRVPLRWWLFALSPVLLLGAVCLVDLVAGQPLPSPMDMSTFGGLASSWGVLGVLAALVLVNGFGEETGWRGYALPTLQLRHSPLVSTLIVTLGWAAWHAPMFAVVNTFRSFGAAVTVGWLIGISCGAVVLSWLYNRSGGSIALVAIWHGSYNLVSGTAAATGLLAAVSTTLVILLAVVIVALEMRATRRGLPSVLGPCRPYER